MWNQVKSLLFGAPSPAPELAFSSEAIRAAVQRLLATDYSTESSRELYNEAVYQTLLLLDAEIEKVRLRANGYPANPISADVWVTGAEYSGLACALTRHFKTAGWLKREESASGLWAKATLAVNSHYHHLVGPAMLANADCHERLGDSSRAAEMYTGVIKDFASFVDAWLPEAAAPPGEDRTSLECLKTAVDRLLALGYASIADHDLHELRANVGNILNRPWPKSEGI